MDSFRAKALKKVIKKEQKTFEMLPWWICLFPHLEKALNSFPVFLR
jgi:hypothetical protein